MTDKKNHIERSIAITVEKKSTAIDTNKQNENTNQQQQLQYSLWINEGTIQLSYLFEHECRHFNSQRVNVQSVLIVIIPVFPFVLILFRIAVYDLHFFFVVSWDNRLGEIKIMAILEWTNQINESMNE